MEGQPKDVPSTNGTQKVCEKDVSIEIESVTQQTQQTQQSDSILYPVASVLMLELIFGGVLYRFLRFPTGPISPPKFDNTTEVIGVCGLCIILAKELIPFIVCLILVPLEDASFKKKHERLMYSYLPHFVLVLDFYWLTYPISKCLNLDHARCRTHWINILDSHKSKFILDIIVNTLHLAACLYCLYIYLGVNVAIVILSIVICAFFVCGIMYRLNKI
eukprot:105022_1